VLVVGVVCTLVFFFFSTEHKGPVGGAAKLGIWYLMVSFGAAYGFTVMSRISLLIGRFQFLLGKWLGNRPRLTPCKCRNGAQRQPPPRAFRVFRLAFDDVPGSGAGAMRATSAARRGALPSLLWYALERPDDSRSAGGIEARASLDLARCAARRRPGRARPDRRTRRLPRRRVDLRRGRPARSPELGGRLADSCRALVAASSGADRRVRDRVRRRGTAGRRGRPALLRRELRLRGGRRRPQAHGQRATPPRPRLLQQGSLLVGPGHERLGRTLQGGTRGRSRAAR
jgi:hypothetical protein